MESSSLTYLRQQASLLIGDLRGLRSRAYLRGIAAGVRRELEKIDPNCPYLRATPHADAYSAGMAEGLEWAQRQSSRETQPSSRPPSTSNVSNLVAFKEASPAESNHEFWNAEQLETAVDLYANGAPLTEIAKALQRTPNAVVWQLWTIAGTNGEVLEMMRTNGHTKPLYRADLRVSNHAFKWVLRHLRAATDAWLRANRDVTLDVLFQKANHALKEWPPAFGGPEAIEIERAAAIWLFNNPAAWLFTDARPQHGRIDA